MRLEVKKYLHDIQEAGRLTAEFTAAKGFEDYERDAMLQAAVERQFEIIGEALGRLSKLDEEAAARISGRRRIIAFRNILIHGYADVDPGLVWDVATTHLPRLLQGSGSAAGGVLNPAAGCA